MVLPVSFASYSFTTDKPDSGHWMQGAAPHSGMGTAGRGQKQSLRDSGCGPAKASPTAQMAATNLTPRARSHNTGDVPFSFNHSWSEASTGGSFMKQEVERGSMAECIIGI